MHAKHIGSLEIETFVEACSLRALESDWWDLYARSDNPTPFQTPTWLIRWAEQTVGSPRLVTIRDAGRLVALGPFFLMRDADETVLTLMGAGESDYLDILVDGRVNVAAASAEVLHVVLDVDGPWDRCDLQQLRPTSALVQAPLPSHARGALVPGEPCAVLRLDRHAGRLPRRIERNIAYYTRKASRVGTLRVETASANSIGRFIGALERLHQSRWTCRRQPGMFVNAALRHLIAESADDLYRREALLLIGLTLDDRLIAVLLGFMDRRTVYYYLGGFDPDFAQYSPGTLLIAAAVDVGRRRGAAEFDFMRGLEEYKLLWGAEPAPTFDRTIRRA